MAEMAAVRDYYGVPARRGGRVAYTWPTPRRVGTILSARDHKLWIRFDDSGTREGPFHPTWEIEYLA